MKNYLRNLSVAVLASALLMTSCGVKVEYISSNESTNTSSLDVNSESTSFNETESKNSSISSSTNNSSSSSSISSSSSSSNPSSSSFHSSSESSNSRPSSSSSSAYSYDQDKLEELKIAEKFVGYGYNSLSKTPLCAPDSLMRTSSIFDFQKMKYDGIVQTFGGLTESEANHKVSNSRSEIVMSLGSDLSGDVAFPVSAVQVSAGFDVSAKSKIGKIAQEQFEYYGAEVSVFQIIYQLNGRSWDNYLVDNFRQRLFAIKTESDVINFYKDFGTHVPTGLILGGIIEIQNYFAANSVTYERQLQTGLKAQIETAISLGKNSAGGGFSFNSEYESKDNNKNSVNIYKCKSYGGTPIENLTIDQIFSFRGGLGGAGTQQYVYKEWLDGISNKENLCITRLPQGTTMKPLWEFLPSDSKYDPVRDLMVNYYVKEGGSIIQNHIKQFEALEIESEDYAFEKPQAAEYKENGFTVSFPAADSENKYISTYVSSNSVPRDTNYLIRKGSYVFMDYEENLYDGLDVEWRVSRDSKCDIIDKRTGVFKITGDSGEFSVSLVAGGTKTLSESTRNFKITNYSLPGDGTQSNPYIISNKHDFMTFATNKDATFLSKAFKLNADIDLDNTEITAIADSNGEFNGIFNGNYHTINHLKLNLGAKEAGLFGKNKGTIRDLNLRNVLIEGETTNSLYIGAICSENSKGTIQNCSITNLTLNVVKSGGKSNDEARVGGIVGYNQSTIDRCTIKNATFSYKHNGTGSYLFMGGIAGHCEYTTSNGNTPTIKRCMIEDFSMYGYANDRIGVGGILGWTDGLSCSDCIARDQKAEGLTAEVKGDLNDYAQVGGICGRINADGNCAKTFSNVIAYNVFDVKAPKRGSKGLFIGGTVSKPDISFSQCYAHKPSNVTLNAINGDRSGSGSVTILEVSSFGQSELEKFTFVNQASDDNPYSVKDFCPEINNVTVDFDSIEITFKSKKDDYLLGEYFKSPDVEIYYEVGNESYRVFDYVINVESFNNKTIGTYPISIECYGKTEIYYVTVREPVVKYIYVQELEHKVYSYNEKIFDKNTIKLMAVYEDGTEKEVPQNKYDAVFEKGYVDEGNNIVKISYGDFTETYFVQGFKKKIDHINISNKAQLEASSYQINQNVNFKDLISLEIVYEDGSKEIVDAKNDSRLQIINPGISKGSVTIYAVYDYVHIAGFTVKGS